MTTPTQLQALISAKFPLTDEAVLLLGVETAQAYVDSFGFHVEGKDDIFTACGEQCNRLPYEEDTSSYDEYKVLFGLSN